MLMETLHPLLASLFLSTFLSCAQNPSTPNSQFNQACEDCELMLEGMPGNLSWETKLAEENEPGERMIISGTIFKKDSQTTAPGVVLYIYQTDAQGKYSTTPNQKNGKQHGHLRGWMKTDGQGRYKFSTIRPASYPNSRAPQHIHPIIKEPSTQCIGSMNIYLMTIPILLMMKKKGKKNEEALE